MDGCTSSFAKMVRRYFGNGCARIGYSTSSLVKVVRVDECTSCLVKVVSRW